MILTMKIDNNIASYTIHAHDKKGCRQTNVANNGRPPMPYMCVWGMVNKFIISEWNYALHTINGDQSQALANDDECLALFYIIT